MPILVQWKWVERTKSFLVIFHFTDDYSKTNLRMHYVYQIDADAIDLDSTRKEAMMTWAPSHIEVGLLSEILKYANIINGFSELEKRGLINKLHRIKMKGREEDWGKIFRRYVNEFEQAEIGRICIEGHLEEEELHFILELSPKYVDYLKKLLEPYLK